MKHVNKNNISASISILLLWKDENGFNIRRGRQTGRSGSRFLFSAKVGLLCLMSDQIDHGNTFAYCSLTSVRSRCFLFLPPHPVCSKCRRNSTAELVFIESLSVCPRASSAVHSQGHWGLTQSQIQSNSYPGILSIHGTVLRTSRFTCQLWWCSAKSRFPYIVYINCFANVFSFLFFRKSVPINNRIKWPGDYITESVKFTTRIWLTWFLLVAGASNSFWIPHFTDSWEMYDCLIKYHLRLTALV